LPCNKPFSNWMLPRGAIVDFGGGDAWVDKGAISKKNKLRPMRPVRLAHGVLIKGIDT
jgi:hypothetical protein